MLGLLVSLLLVGIVAGYLGRLLVMGPDPMGFWATVLLGIAGSLLGGTVGSLIFTGRLGIHFGSFLLAIPGAVIALLIYRRVKYGTIMPPHGRRP
jgi:uncharacterized membrane protein YeaQ/YmgE (transglycosylase-associated protein family)